MNYSFEYIDIILLAMIAGFIFLRLRGILGKKSGFEEDITQSFPHEFPNTNPTKKSNFDIVDLINNSIEMLEISANKKNIKLMIDHENNPPINVNADKEKIEQVIINLIENSIKYGKENGTTEIVVQDLVENKIIVRVTDNGIGVEENHLDRLFERFYRVDQSGSRSSGGSGLGLAIVKTLSLFNI